MTVPGTITVAEHVREPDGQVRLTLRLVGPLPEDPLVMLAGCGGTVLPDGDDALIGWTWLDRQAPADPLSLCAAHVRGLLIGWAASAAEPQGLVLTDPGTVV